jgi:hypothetical protein
MLLLLKLCKGSRKNSRESSESWELSGLNSEQVESSAYCAKRFLSKLDSTFS